MTQKTDNLIMGLREIIWTIEDFLSVETKDGRVVPFYLNNKQRQLVGDIAKSHKPRRVLILKGRQFGFSTLILAIFFVKCLLVQNTRAAIIAHDEESTKRLFRRVRFFASMLVIKPELDKESEKMYSFPDTNSTFYIGTAGQKTFGRGDNLTDLHCSEVAFWKNTGETMNGLLQAVGMTGNVYIETTANGFGNYFQRLWQKSWQNTNAAWHALFYSWIDFREYEMEVPDDFVRTREEEYLCRIYPKLTNRKLMWRRWKISETEVDTDSLMAPEELFQQEYPLCPEEAFIATGNPVFSVKALLAYKTREGIKEGNLTIFKRPGPNSDYVIFADVAEGLAKGDYSCIQVLNRKTWEQVAVWHGKIDPDKLGEEMIDLGKMYNWAFMSPETNNQGIATIIVLKTGYPHDKLYWREVLDERTKKRTRKSGWYTNDKTRRLMVGDAIKAIRDHLVLINDVKTINECITFVRNEKGKPEAQEGCYDDRVMALCGAIQMALAFEPAEGKVFKHPDTKERITQLTPEVYALENILKRRKEKRWEDI